MKMNCSQCGYDCLGCFQRLQQNAEEQAEIILKRNLEIIELSQRVGVLKKQLAEAQAEVERLKDNISTGDFVYKAVSRQRDDFREASECFLRTWKRAGPLGSHWYSTAEGKWFCCSCGNPRIRLPQITPAMIEAVKNVVECEAGPHGNTCEDCVVKLQTAFANVLKGDEDAVSEV